MAQNYLRSIDTVVTHQALIVGQVTDGLTGRQTVHPFDVELRYQTAMGQPPRRFPLTPRLDSSGLFVFAGLPTTAFPRLSPGETLDLCLAVSAPRYQTQEIDVTLTDADLALVDQVLSVGTLTTTASVLNAPLVEQTVALLPDARRASTWAGASSAPTILSSPYPTLKSVSPHAKREARSPVTTDRDCHTQTASSRCITCRSPRRSPCASQRRRTSIHS